jgi:hypothetical protein
MGWFVATGDGTIGGWLGIAGDGAPVGWLAVSSAYAAAEAEKQNTRQAAITAR